MDVVFIRTEEAKMVKEFGSDYHQYRQKVRRWIYTGVAIPIAGVNLLVGESLSWSTRVEEVFL